MGKYQEVEVRFPLLNRNDVIEEIKKLGLHSKVKDEIQKDSYYTPIHRDFLEPEIVSEWFRVRETNNKCSLNFKQWLPIGAKVQNQCNEYETVIEDVYALKQILNLLNFKEIITVNKTRNSWVIENVEISIDLVDSLGAFIELEAMDRVDEKEIASIHEHFNRILAKIKAKIGERDHRGYPYLLIEKNKEIGE